MTADQLDRWGMYGPEVSGAVRVAMAAGAYNYDAIFTTFEDHAAVQVRAPGPLDMPRAEEYRHHLNMLLVWHDEDVAPFLTDDQRQREIILEGVKRMFVRSCKYGFHPDVDFDNGWQTQRGPIIVQQEDFWQ